MTHSTPQGKDWAAVREAHPVLPGRFGPPAAKTSNGRKPVDFSAPRESQAVWGGPAEVPADVKIVQTIAVQRPVEIVYRAWRDFTNWPRFVDDVVAIQAISDRRFIWTIQTPEGEPLALDLEILAEQENRLMAWSSIPGAGLDHVGMAHFKPISRGRATQVNIWVGLSPFQGAGSSDRASRQIGQSLYRFKQFVEAGA